MSCEKNLGLVTRVARRWGIPLVSSKSAAVTATGPQVSFFGLTESSRPKTKRAGRRKTRSAVGQGTGSNGVGGRAEVQKSFFKLAEAKPATARTIKSWLPAEPLPTQRQIRISGAFSDEELQTLSVQLRLGAAAVARRLRELNSGVSPGIGHSDPRPIDWARADQKNYQFLVAALDEARPGRGALDTGPLRNNELVDLWEFSRFEADRAMRNIDHLTSGLSHLKGPTADYLVGRHMLEARFYSFLADQLEPLLTPEMIDAYNA